MSDPEQPPLTPRQQAARDRRLAQVFGDVLPEQTRDDSAAPDASDPDAHLHREVPPHHGS